MSCPGTFWHVARTGSRTTNPGVSGPQPIYQLRYDSPSYEISVTRCLKVLNILFAHVQSQSNVGGGHHAVRFSMNNLFYMLKKKTELYFAQTGLLVQNNCILHLLHFKWAISLSMTETSNGKAIFLLRSLAYSKHVGMFLPKITL